MVVLVDSRGCSRLVRSAILQGMTIVDGPYKDAFDEGYCVACNDFSSHLCEFCDCCLSHHARSCPIRKERNGKSKKQKMREVAQKVIRETYSRVGKGCM